MRYGYLRDACLRYGYLRYAFLRYATGRYASFRDGHLHNRLVPIHLWIDAFMIWTILFKILIIEFGHGYTSISVDLIGLLVLLLINSAVIPTDLEEFYLLLH